MGCPLGIPSAVHTGRVSDGDEWLRRGQEPVPRAPVAAGVLGERKLATFRNVLNRTRRLHPRVAPPDRHQAAVQFILKGMRPPAGFDALPSRHEGECVVCTRALDYGRVKAQVEAGPGTGLETQLANSKESLKRAVGVYQK